MNKCRSGMTKSRRKSRSTNEKDGVENSTPSPVLFPVNDFDLIQVRSVLANTNRI